MILLETINDTTGNVVGIRPLAFIFPGTLNFHYLRMTTAT